MQRDFIIEHDYISALNALDQGGGFTHAKFKYASTICNLVLRHPVARTAAEMNFLTNHISVMTNMKWLQHEVGDARGVNPDDLRIAFTSIGGFHPIVTVGLVVKKDMQSWDVIVGGRENYGRGGMEVIHRGDQE